MADLRISSHVPRNSKVKDLPMVSYVSGRRNPELYTRYVLCIEHAVSSRCKFMHRVRLNPQFYISIC